MGSEVSDKSELSDYSETSDYSDYSEPSDYSETSGPAKNPYPQKKGLNPNDLTLFLKWRLPTLPLSQYHRRDKV